MEKAGRYHSICVAAVPIVLLLSACAPGRNAKTEQVAHVAVAEAALQDAQHAGGSEFAPYAITSATEKLQLAHNAVNQKEYVSAQRLAEEAEADANLAKASAQSGKAKKAAEEVQKSLQSLQQELSSQTTGGSSTIK